MQKKINVLTALQAIEEVLNVKGVLGDSLYECTEDKVFAFTKDFTFSPLNGSETRYSKRLEMFVDSDDVYSENNELYYDFSRNESDLLFGVIIFEEQLEEFLEMLKKATA